MVNKTLLFTVAMALGISTTAFAANPFSDVPAGHWAYASVAKLAAAGIVDGYPDGAFKGQRTMTRYEMAQIVAKALAKGAIGADDKLVSEFGEELDNLGVRVARLEKNADQVKITGEARFRYFHSNKKTLGADGDKSFETDLRTRLNFAGEVNDNWHYNGMLENTQDLGDDSGNGDTKLLRAYMEGNIGSLGVRAGRFDYYMADGLVLDTDGDSVDGVELKLGDEEKTALTLGYGKLGIDGDGSKFFGAEAKGKHNNLGFKAGYYRFKSTPDTPVMGENPTMVDAGLSYSFGPLVTLSADYLHGNKGNMENRKNGYAFGLTVGEADPEKVGSIGFFTNYWDQPRGTFYAHSTDANVFDDANTGFKGWGIGLNYAPMKNGVVTVAYFDTKEKGGENRKDKRLWTDLTVTF